MARGMIKIGRHTKAHGDWLRGKGYTVNEVDGNFIIDAPGGFVDGNVDLGDTKDSAVAALKALTEKKQLCSYSTRFRFPDGTVKYGFPACAALGAASALIAKAEKQDKTPAPTGFSF